MILKKYQSTIGVLTLGAEGEKLCGLWIEGQKNFMAGSEQGVFGNCKAIELAENWLNSYFAGEKPCGRELCLCPAESKFAAALREVLLDIPYGESRSYAQIAKEMEKFGYSPKCYRAVGSALGKNPISIVVPCHRVLSASGLGGYAGGLDIKKWLLRHEKIIK